MRKQLQIAIGLWLLTTLVAGVLYPLAVWTVGQLCCPTSASGGAVFFQERCVGCHQIGQQWNDPAFFWGRPSSRPHDEEWAISGSSALSPASYKLYDMVMKRKEKLLAISHQTEKSDSLLPNELLFASASGLDPHLHRASLLYQIPRIANARQLTEEQEKALVTLVTQFRGTSMLKNADQEHLHVLTLNIALENQFPLKN